MAILNHEAFAYSDAQHRQARSIARNYRLSKDQRAYSMRKVRQYGFRLWELAVKYVAAIEQAEREHPNRCVAHIDEVAEGIVKGKAS